MDIEVDWPNYEKARKTEILKGNYLQLEIIIPATSQKTFLNGGCSPICHLVQHNNTIFDIALLYKTLDLYMRNLESKYPEACKYAKDTFGIKSIYDAEEEPNDENI